LGDQLVIRSRLRPRATGRQFPESSGGDLTFIVVRHIMRLALVRLIITVALMTGSAEAQKPYQIFGQGTLSCGSWTASRRDRTALGLEQWILGFLSGAGFVGSTSSVGVDPLKGVDADGAWAWMDNYCRNQPLKELADAAMAFVYSHPR
jgi:hypothetical protein